MPVHGSNARLYANGYDLSSYFRGGGPKMAVDTAEVTVWGNAAKAYIPGRMDASWAGEGLFDFDLVNANRADDILGPALAGSAELIHLPSGDGAGNPAYLISGCESSYEVTSPYDDVTSFSMEVQSSRGPLWGKVLYAFTGTLPITAGGNGTDIDDQSYLAVPSSSALGAVGMLQVINKGGGAGTLTVKIQHASTLPTYADLITFTAVTAKNQKEAVEVLPGVTINRYVRALWTLTGGTWDINVSFARRRAY